MKRRTFMTSIPGNLFWRSSLAILAVVVAGCGAADEIDVQASGLSLVPPVPGLPDGLVCGLSYTNSSDSNSCLGVSTLSGGAASNFNNRQIGDRGLPSGRGFRDQASRGSGQATIANSDKLALVPGTVCGFKETCNNGGELCMGYDPRFECPRGWIQQTAWDASSPSGCSFAWCSYDDPYSKCCDGSTCNPACLANMPQGTACGLGDSRTGFGWCQTQFVLSAGCPAGFHRSSGNFDAGRSAGSGLYWCTKN
jgi:hypothetical protein